MGYHEYKCLQFQRAIVVLFFSFSNAILYPFVFLVKWRNKTSLDKSSHVTMYAFNIYCTRDK